MQGARHAGAEHIVAVDPVEFKRTKALELGATHTAESAGRGARADQQLTRGVGADKAIITVSVADAEVVHHAFEVVRKGGNIASRPRRRSAICRFRSRAIPDEL